MLVIGMGKRIGAKMAHDWAVKWSLHNMIPDITEQLLDTLPIAGGIAILENQHDNTISIEGLQPDDFLSRESELLDMAADLMPTLPFDELDVLIVDRLGKDISGQGMDTNVTGRRHFTINEPEPENPIIKRIYTRGFTNKTDGNGMGMGQADIVHKDILNALNWSKSLINAITASTVRGVRLPPVVESDYTGIKGCLGTIGPYHPENVRILRITDTMHLKRCYASEALIEATRSRSDLKVVEEPYQLEFDQHGNFRSPSPTYQE
jgi:hypothetical protein